jgi:hypothetical protein
MIRKTYHSFQTPITTKNTLRLCLSISWILITTFAWFFPIAITQVKADDETPVPTEEVTDPIFPLVTSMPEEKGQTPLYNVPLALNPHDHFFFTRPIAMDTNSAPSSDFRYGFYYPEDTTIHTGVDIISPLHTPVLAAGDGQVIFVGYGLMNGGGDVKDPYGLAVLIRHTFSYGDKTLYTVYGHLDRIDVEKDQFVKVGDQIGIIGMTGNTSGPHVHFEVRIEDSEGGRVQNPELWLAPPVGSGVLAGRLKDNIGNLIAAQQLWLKSLETGYKYDITSYAPVKHIYSDDYFHENFTIGDIPAGEYEISMVYKNKWYRSNLTIAPGTVNYVTFNGKNGFEQGLPAAPNAEEFLQ